MTIPLVVRKVETQQAALRNIRRALDTLEGANSIDPVLSRADRDILQGKSGTIIIILDALINLWKQKNPYY